MKAENISTYSKSHYFITCLSLAFHQSRSVLDTKTYTSEGGGIRRGLQVGPGQWCRWNSMEYLGISAFHRMVDSGLRDFNKGAT